MIVKPVPAPAVKPDPQACPLCGRPVIYGPVHWQCANLEAFLDQTTPVPGDYS